MKTTVFRAAIVVCLFLPVFAWAGQPMDDLKPSVEKVMSLLKESTSQTKKEQEATRQQVMHIIKDVFDFNEISMRTIAIYWKTFSEEQQKEFSDIFAEFLGSSYYEKIRESYADQNIIYDSQDIESENKALVKTRIPREAGDIPIYYRMLLKDGKWKVYDVIIEKISLVKNYRTQFRSILRKESPGELIERLKKKIAEQQHEDRDMENQKSE